MDSAKDNTLFKSLRRSLKVNSGPKISNEVSLEDRLSLGADLGAPTTGSAQNLLRNIKQKFKFKKNKFLSKKVSSMEGNLHNLDSVNFSGDLPPAVPPRPLFTFEEGQYVDIPAGIRQERIVSSQINTTQNNVNDAVSVISCTEGPQTSFRDAISSLSKYGWYWGPLSRKEAELKLESQPDGAFLVRNSYSNNYFFTVSFRSWGMTMHARIDYKNGQYTIMDQQGFPSVGSLIEEGIKRSKNNIYCYSRPRNAVEPSYAVRLTKPISRHSQLKDLKYLCRFVIRQYISVDNIQKLPVPESIHYYLSQSQF